MRPAGAVVGEMQNLAADLELCRGRVGNGDPRVAFAVDADALACVVPAVRPALGTLARPRVLQGPGGGGVVAVAVEAADEAFAVDALDAEVLQVVRAYDHVDVAAAVAPVPAHPGPATRPRGPRRGGGPQQGAR